jgi:hypothetical protein
MKNFLFTLIFITLFTNCKNSENKTVEKTERIELAPEPDKYLEEEYEKQKQVYVLNCVFSNPDTSVVGIKIRNAESTLKILGQKTKLEGDSTHVFYSSNKKQLLGLSVHAGDHYSQVSIFNISYSENPSKNLRRINSEEFKTEKGIKLGINKKEIIEKLGHCYITKDSTKNHLVMFYSIELSKDSKTKLLEKNNMPIYYAKYKLIGNKLKNIEFGFEYP